MSQAFIRESDEQRLADIDPTMNALINFLNSSDFKFESWYIMLFQ